MNYYKQLKSMLTVDIRDVLFFAGLTMFGYGLYLLKGQWLTFTVCGPMIMAIGYLMRDKQKG